jgi:hypothetical protein
MNRRELLKNAGLVGLLMAIDGCKKSEAPKQEPIKPVDEKEERLRNAVLSYLSQPKFASSDFAQQITGTSISLEMYYVDTKVAYFSIPINKYKHPDTLTKLTKDIEKVRFGQPQNGRLVLDTLSFSGKGKHFFKFPSDDFKVDPKKVLRYNFRNLQYTITMNELMDFIDNKTVYGGNLKFITGYSGNIPKVLINHGAYVGVKGEDSLERLVAKITKGARSKEDKSQRLLDFTTQQLKYNDSDANSSVEIMKRPNEVLMTKGSDCSGKVILYSSLLEQTDVDYRLIYLPRKKHISVAVAGNFRDTNGYSFKIGNKTYHAAETTAKGFKIGESILNESLDLESIDYLQKPNEVSVITDKSGKKVDFT